MQHVLGGHTTWTSMGPQIRMSGYPAVVNLYLLVGAVEAGFVNLWIIGYAVILLLCGQR